MRGLVLLGMTMIAVETRAQFDFGISAGPFGASLHASDDRWSPWAKPTQDYFPIVAVTYRERLPVLWNFFAEVDWRQFALNAHLEEGGHGGGVRTDLRAEFQSVRLVVGPEFGTRRISIRSGIHIGWVVGGRASGSWKSWSIYPPPQGGWYRGEIDAPASKYFSGGGGFLLAARYSQPMGKRYSLVLDPYVVAPLGSFHRGHNRIRSFESGVRIGVLRSSKGRGVWQRLRAGGSVAWKRLREGAPE